MMPFTIFIIILSLSSFIIIIILFFSRIKSDNTREDIFSHAILVLSKCDKVGLGCEYEVMELICQKSKQLQNYPYK